MDYSEMTDHALLKLASKQGGYNQELNIEWKSRKGMSFPYLLTDDGHIRNCLIKALVGDRECDKLILEQANELRARIKAW